MHFKMKVKALFDINGFEISSPYEHVLATLLEKQKTTFFGSIHEHVNAAITEL